MGKVGLQEAHDAGYSEGYEAAKDEYQYNDYDYGYSYYNTDPTYQEGRTEARQEILDLLAKKIKNIPPTRLAEKKILTEARHEIENYL